MKRGLKKGLKILGWTIFTIVLLLFAATLCLQIPYVQNKVKDFGVSYLQDKIGTEVALEHIYINFPNEIELRGLFLRDQKQDTLVFAKDLRVKMNLLDLLNSKANITDIELSDFVGGIKRDSIGTFNFDYIISAFANPETPKDTTSSNFTIDLDKIKLNRIKFTFEDIFGGNDVKLNLREFETRVDQFDLKNLLFSIPEIKMAGLKVGVKRDLLKEIIEQTAEKIDSISNNVPLQIKLKSIDLRDFDVTYYDDNARIDAKLDFKKLVTNIEDIDLPKLDFKVNDLVFDQANINVKLLQNPKNITSDPIDVKADDIIAASPKFSLKNADLSGLKVVYSNLSAKKSTNSGIDFNYLNFLDLNLEASDLVYTETEIKGEIESAKIKEKSGLQIDDFETLFYYGPKRAQLSKIYLKTPQTEIKDEVQLTYNTVEDLSKKLGNVGVEARLRKSKIAFKDILILAPDLKKQDIFKNNPNAVLHLDTRITGKVNDLTIPDFNLTGLRSTHVKVSGSIKNALNPDQLYVDLNVDQLKSTRADIVSLLPKNTLPNSISLPEIFAIKGKVKGTLKNTATNLQLTSSYGGATINGFINQNKKNAEVYDLKANLNQFNVGKLIKNDSLGRISADVFIKGKSFNPELMQTAITGTIKEANFNGYTYKNMALHATVDKGYYAGDINFNDANADVNITAEGRIKGEHPSLQLNGNIGKLDLYKLRLTQQPMALKGELLANFSDLHPDHLNGKLRLYNFAYADGKQVYPFDSIKIDAISENNLNKLLVKSQILDAEVSGKYTVTQLPQLLTQTISKYYQIGNPKDKKLDPKDTQLTLQAKIKNDRILYNILPNLKGFETISIAGGYLAAQDSLALQAIIPNLIYGANTIENVKVNLDTKNEKLVYNLGVNKLQSEAYLVKNISLSGEVANNSIAYLFKIKDDKDKEQYKINGSLATLNDITQVKLTPDGLVLNYDTWKVNENNVIELTSKSIHAFDFILENKSSKLTVASENNQVNAPLNIEFKDFQIESLTHIIKKDSLLAKGTINGKAQLRDLKGKVKFLGSVLISDLEVMNAKVGNLDVKVTNTRKENTYNALITLTGNNNNVKIFGGYNPINDDIRLQANIEALQMQTIQGFATKMISNTNGFLSGKLSITGNVSSPKIIGEAKFNNVGLTVKALNATFKDINQPIIFNEEGIRFNQFEITDAENNKLRLNGRILTKNYKDFAFNLRLRADNFKLMNSTAKDNDLFYGKLYINTNMNITGTLDLPVVDGSIQVNDDTDFTFVLPSQDPSIADREGIVEFIDEDNLVLQQTLELQQELNESRIKGINLNASIIIKKEATLNIIIDKQNGDKLTVYGEAELTGGLDPSGKTSLTGTYEIDKGSYEMSFNFIKRKFEIQKGSTIVWTGEPTSANANITAIYKTNTSPIDLLDSQLQNMSAAQRNTYKQRVPFETYLMMNGELLKPEITFDIKMAEDNYNISSDVESAVEEKLRQIRNDQAEMNKQVIAILVLNRFIGENPFASSVGNSVEGMARQSVSKIISQQLNNLASELVKGFELNFDLESADDFSTGEQQTRTDLNVELSKRLFDDRLKITIGSNFGLEGQERANEQMTNIAGDISAEYTLTEDGRYIVRAYRKNRYQVTFQGQVVETGVGFIITMSYTKFKELFQKRKENRAFRREENQRVRERNQERLQSAPPSNFDSIPVKRKKPVDTDQSNAKNTNLFISSKEDVITDFLTTHPLVFIKPED